MLRVGKRKNQAPESPSWDFGKDRAPGSVSFGARMQQAEPFLPPDFTWPQVMRREDRTAFLTRSAQLPAECFAEALVGEETRWREDEQPYPGEHEPLSMPVMLHQSEAETCKTSP